MAAKVIKCGCVSKEQDRLHGEHMRVHNEDSKGNLRCTICGDTKRPVQESKKGK